jgi:hypothetical protein
MTTVTLSMTENEARVLVQALGIAVSYIDRGEPYDGILKELKLTDEETKDLRIKMQKVDDTFNRKLSSKLGYEVGIDPINWPPTDLRLLEYLLGSLSQQISEP